ncbi:MAG TPA: penicillin-binding protein 1C [Flavobacteriaceae bacterium]|nr:penicillin-binding protein 1C [Flavobacteriaceae bacterium]HQU19977.1 penicillin-binding protein 1C [Flavobacteriaceae bacterium]HQU64037.1 penicillin-binding protein 1C [Flavobacteriaceae bacterium]HRW45126.1 penicillin-binding protein 1C [Flavobacteriaceae bacterium]
MPKPLFNDAHSTVVESKEGYLMGARIADDGQWRFPEMDSVPSRFEKAIIYFEDEHFYNHPGFNPVSMSKALWQNLTTKNRRGGSTLTQQVIRLSRKNRSRSYFEKGIELFMATRLEVRYSKKDILRLYASHAPFGGNVVGLETASWRYFGIPSYRLSWGQTAALAVLPNAPSLIFPGKNEVIFKNKRDRLLKKLFENEVIDETTYQLAIEEPLPGKPMPLPDTAPHLTEKVRREFPGQRLVSSLEFSLQKRVNQIVKEHHHLLSQNEINNLAVLVLDVDSRKVLAYVGNAPSDGEHNPFVDIIDKSRSTGSILKPFLYAAAMDSGELLPEMLVADVPTVINGYSPENFDNQFNGAVPANVALSRSLNVPAVRLLRSYGLDRFYNRLKELHFTTINQPANHYGLSLILGGAESSLWEITNTYAGLAATLNFFNNSSSEYPSNAFRKPSITISSKADFIEKTSNPPVFDAGSIYKTFEALREVNRPQGEENWAFFSNSQPIAWKTGTSFGFKDAWAVGVTPKYAIGVWVGNADGEGRPGLTGVQAAAPVLFDVLRALPSSGWFGIPYDALVEADVCVKSGHLAGPYCDPIRKEWIPKEGLKSTTCPYHQTVFLNTERTLRVNSSCYSLSEMKQESWFSLPPVMEYYYGQKHPEYQALPPYQLDCLKDNELPMEFIFPKMGEAIVLPRNLDETLNEVVFSLAHHHPDSTVYWYLDDQFIGATHTFHELGYQPKPGTYMLIAVDNLGNEIKESITITLASP